MEDRQLITSLQNPRIKAAIKLRDTRQRQKQGRIIIDGARELLRALQAGVELLEVYVCEELCTSNDCQALLKALAEPVAHRIRIVPHGYHPRYAAVFAKLAYGARAEGVVGVAKTPATSLADLSLPANPLVAVLEGVEKPGNVGAVLRSADAAGVSASHRLRWRHRSLQSQRDSREPGHDLHAAGLCRDRRRDTRMAATAEAIDLYGRRWMPRLEYTAADFTQPCAIVLGSEAQRAERPLAHRSGRNCGLAAGQCDQPPIKLPMLGVADSLNVSNAAAVLFYEACCDNDKETATADCEHSALRIPNSALTLPSPPTPPPRACSSKQHRHRQRPHAAGHGRDVAGHSRHGRIIDVAAQLPIDTVHAHVDHDRAGLHHVRP